MKRLVRNLLAIGIMLSMTLSSIKAMEALEPVKTPAEERKQDEITIYLADGSMNIKKTELEQLAKISLTIKNILEDVGPIAQLDEFNVGPVSISAFQLIMGMVDDLVAVKKAPDLQAKKQAAANLIAKLQAIINLKDQIELINAAEFLEITSLLDYIRIPIPKAFKDKQEYEDYLAAISTIPKDLLLKKADLKYQLIKYILEQRKYTQMSLTGHAMGISSVAISPDGKFIVTGSYDKTAIVWDSKTGQQLHRLIGHTGNIDSVAVSPDGSFIVTGSWDNTAIIWDSKTGQQLDQLTNHTAPINSVAISPDSTFIVTGSIDKTAIIWDSTTGKQRHILTNHADSINSVAISPDGSFIVTGSGDGTAIIWDSTTGKQRHILTNHADSINSVAISSDGSFIVTGSRNGNAIIWDSKTGKQLYILTGHTMGISSVAISTDGRFIVTGSDDNTAIIWDSKKGKKLHKLFQGYSIESVAISPDDKFIISGSIVWQLLDPTFNIDQLAKDQIVLLLYILINKQFSIPDFMQPTYDSLPTYLRRLFPVTFVKTTS